MANFTNRVSELEGLLRAAAEAAGEVDARALKAMTDSVKKWAGKREDHLGGLVAIAERATPSNLGSPKKWSDRVAAARKDLSSIFGDSVKDVLLPPALQLFWFGTLQAEDKFLDSLGAVTTPQLHDDILAHQARHAQLIEDLHEKWQLLLAKHKSFETDEGRAVDLLDRMVQDTAAGLAKYRTALKQKMAGLASKVGSTARKVADLSDNPLVEVAKKAAEKALDIELPDEIDDVVDALADSTGDYYDALEGTTRQYRELVAKYQGLLKRENGSVLTLFNQTRKDVERYLKDNDVSRFKTVFDQAKGKLSDWASKRVTTGQRDDANALRDQVTKHISGHWARTLDLDKEFRNKYKGVFLGPLGSKTIEDLVKEDFFEDKIERVASRDVEDKLEDAHSDLPDEIDDGVDSAFKVMADAIDDLPSEIRDFARGKNRKLEAQVKKHLEQEMNKVVKALNKLMNLIERMELDFSRESLKRSLR